MKLELINKWKIESVMEYKIENTKEKSSNNYNVDIFMFVATIISIIITVLVVFIKGKHTKSKH